MSRRSIPEYSAAELYQEPTLAVGQTDDLKREEEYDGVPYRWWLCRCTTADGMRYNNQVTIEACLNGKWVTIKEYPGGRV